MDAVERVWMIILLPVLAIYAVIELRRAWKILHENTPSLNYALQIRKWLIGLFKGHDVADGYQASLFNDPKVMKTKGIYSLLEGVLLLLVCAVWIIVLIMNP
jgi:hypothetical protein